MEWCENEHDPIIHDKRDCPLCEVLGENAELQQQVEGHKRYVEDLEGQVGNLEEQLGLRGQGDAPKEQADDTAGQGPSAA